MSTRTFALIFGIVFLAVGVAGFVSPALLHPHDYPDVTMNSFEGDLLGLFPVNALHSLVHVLFGVWGLMASRSLGGSVTYARGVAIIYAVLTVMGFIPPLDVTFGLIPLFGNDIWLHAVLALVAAYFGWVNRNPTTV